jgi:type I restriction enzyme S subunit
MTLPSHWASIKLRDVISIIESGGRPKGGVRGILEGIPSIGGEHLVYNGRFNFDEIRYIPREYYKKMTRGKIKKYDVLVVKDGATTGKTSFVGDDFPFPESAINEHVFILRPKDDLIPKFLFYWFQSSLGQECVADNFRGAAQGGITLGILDNSSFPLAPLPEQERIVSRIEELFSNLESGVMALEHVRAELKSYKASILKAACKGKILESKGIENSESGLPMGWNWSSVEELNPPNRKCAYGVLQPGEDKTDGVVFLRVGDINDGRIDIHNLKRIDPIIAAKYPRTKLQGGEVLITLVGAIGRTALVPESLAGANTARAVGVIPIKDGVHAPWVEIWFRNSEKVIEMTSKAHEVARKTLNLEDVRSAKVALPPLGEQRRIVEEVERRLSVVSEVESAVEVGLVRAARLRQSVLKSAFEGRL